MKDLESKESEINTTESICQGNNSETHTSGFQVLGSEQGTSPQNLGTSEVEINSTAVGTGELSIELDRLKHLAEKLDLENKRLQTELMELKEQYIRKQADFDNFRKRLLRDKEESIHFANKKILEDLVPVLDDFERAIKSSEATQDFQIFHDGIQLIEKQFLTMLEKKWGLIRFDSIDQEFDPQRHEAVSAVPHEGEELQKVLEEYQKGYQLNERVLRTAKVKVSMPVAKGE